MRKKILVILAITAGLAAGCSTEKNSDVSGMIPSEPGNYLIKHIEGRKARLTIAVVHSNGQVDTDTGPLPDGLLMMQAKVPLERCGEVFLIRENTWWTGALTSNPAPADCPLQTLSAGARLFSVN